MKTDRKEGWMLEYWNIFSSIPVSPHSQSVSLCLHLYWISSSTACWGILRSPFTLPRCRVKYIKLLNNTHISNAAFALFVLLCCLLNAAVFLIWVQMQVTKGQTVMDLKPWAELWKNFNVFILTSWINKQINSDDGTGGRSHQKPAEINNGEQWRKLWCKMDPDRPKMCEKLIFTNKNLIFWELLYIIIIWIKSIMSMSCFFLMI